MTVELPLTQGYIAVIDDIDGDLAEFKWRAMVDVRTVYAMRNSSRVGGQKRVGIQLHRVILSRILGRELLRSEKVDHIHHNGLICVREELRLATTPENGWNQQASLRNTSGYKGVSWHKRNKKFIATLECQGVSHHLGYHLTPEDAARAYNKGAKLYFGDRAFLNILPEDTDDDADTPES